MTQPLLLLPGQPAEPFTYVDCGARGERTKPLIEAMPDALYVGFEPDREECARLLKHANGTRYKFFPVALGAKAERQTLHLTRNPACTSLFAPDHEFLGQFMELGPFFDVLAAQPVETVALDTFLPEQGINRIDFIELDTQGAELDILRGAEEFLSSSVLGLQVEVEFTAMYQNQPLFAEVDSYLRRFGLMLFDLSRYRLRRKACPPDVETRGQLMWGHAFYLRDYRTLSGQSEKTNRLAALASFFGFHDYALEIAEFAAGELHGEQHAVVSSAINRYRLSLRNTPLIETLLKLDRTVLRVPLRQLGALCAQIGQAHSFITTKRNYFWKD
jgi:FkbM family methyltransferase